MRTSRIQLLFSFVFLFLGCPALHAQTSSTLVLCSNNVSGQIAAKKKCSKKETRILLRSELVGAQGNTGPAGSTGASGTTGSTGSQGADGTLRIYGDGSAGPLLISSNTNWVSVTPAGNNLQFTSCTIQSGATLTVPSGITLRCSGAVDISGNINVANGAAGGRSSFSSAGSALIDHVVAQPGAGYGRRAATNGEFIASTTGNNAIGGGSAGLGFESNLQAASHLRLTPFGGGGGGGSTVGNDGAVSSGGQGGGALAIIASGAVSISGTISANGEDAPSAGSGGGGGGAVLIASRTSISISGAGVITANGGDGGASNTSRGAGGGGAGGLIHLLSPIVPTYNGTNAIAIGGDSGSTAIDLTLFPRQAGAGGGAGAMDGGSGGSVDTSGNAGSADSGNDGLLLSSVLDPTSVIQ